jgi:hypothetical protein
MAKPRGLHQASAIVCAAYAAEHLSQVTSRAETALPGRHQIHALARHSAERQPSNSRNTDRCAQVRRLRMPRRGTQRALRRNQPTQDGRRGVWCAHRARNTSSLHVTSAARRRIGLPRRVWHRVPFQRPQGATRSIPRTVEGEDWAEAQKVHAQVYANVAVLDYLLITQMVSCAVWWRGLDPPGRR